MDLPLALVLIFSTSLALSVGCALWMHLRVVALKAEIIASMREFKRIATKLQKTDDPAFQTAWKEFQGAESVADTLSVRTIRFIERMQQQGVLRQPERIPADDPSLQEAINH